MKTVLLRGPVLTRSGYGEHTRQILRYLITKNVKVSIQPLNWGVTPWHLNEGSCNGLIGEALKRCDFKPETKYDISIQCQLPNEWDTSLAKYNVGVTAGVETDFANPVWVQLHANKMDRVIVPSHFSKRSLEKKAIASTAIDVVPESYFEELLETPNNDILEDKIETDFNFLTVGVLTGGSPETDRKNLFYLIKWFVEEFKNEKSVGLVVKTNRGRDTTIDRVGTKQLLGSILKELQHTGKPKIYFMHGDMSRAEMCSVYKSKKIKSYITTTRGEGFGLPILEAATAGLPVIGTNWSAHTEFMNLGKWLSLDYTLEAVHDSKIENEIFMKGSKWAEVKEADFKRKLRNFYKKPETPTQWAKELSKRLEKEYSAKSINRKYDELLGEVLG